MSKKELKKSVAFNNNFNGYCRPTIDKIATGKNLKRLRTEAHLSVNDVADYFLGDISCTAIYAWENGEYMPSYSNLIALGSFYGNYTFDDLIVLTKPEGAS